MGLVHCHLTSVIATISIRCIVEDQSFAVQSYHFLFWSDSNTVPEPSYPLCGRTFTLTIQREVYSYGILFSLVGFDGY